VYVGILGILRMRIGRCVVQMRLDVPAGQAVLVHGTYLHGLSSCGFFFSPDAGSVKARTSKSVQARILFDANRGRQAPGRPLPTKRSYILLQSVKMFAYLSSTSFVLACDLVQN